YRTEAYRFIGDLGDEFMCGCYWAAERRQIVATGAARGKVPFRTKPRRGERFARKSVAPLGLRVTLDRKTTALRPRLRSFAARDFYRIAEPAYWRIRPWYSCQR